MRTHEQIVADCERRFEEIQAEAERRNADPIVNYPCEKCRWFKPDGRFESLKDHHCRNPLVVGFGAPVLVGTWRFSAFGGEGVRISGSTLNWRFPMLCGPEKALWQPKLTLCQRIREWFA